jgi:hypothetical protein
MNKLETLILTQVANEASVTSANEAFRGYQPDVVRETMLALSQSGWFAAELVSSGNERRVEVGLVDLKTIRQFSAAQEI